jgi:uncharacterized protein (TIGR02145 family)
MAKISGTVTDTGTTPISGAVVQLEKDGQTATTGVDGRFTLVVSNAVLPGNGKLFPNGLSARISGNMLNVTISELAAVEVAAFDLNGNTLSTVRKTLDAGSHSISLPYRGTGIYLYKVKSGNREFVLKGNSVCGTSSGGLVTSQGSLPNSLAKQAKSMAAINDVIAATKEGYLNYRCVIGNFDTTGLVIKMIANVGNVIDADGNVYTTVNIGNQVWTVENLRTTKYSDGTAITKITDTATWYNICTNKLDTPAYCYFKNTTNADSIKKFGALYNWYAVNTGKLAPTGWHVPTDSEWTIMENYLVLHGYNYDGTTDTSNYDKIAKALSAKTDWKSYTATGTIGRDLTLNNSSGFSALPCGYRDNYGYFLQSYSFCYWWSATEDIASYAWFRVLCYNDVDLFRYFHYKCQGYSVRILKDN